MACRGRYKVEMGVVENVEEAIVEEAIVVGSGLVILHRWGEVQEWE